MGFCTFFFKILPTLSQKERLFRAWRNFCIVGRMAKTSAFVKGLIALEKNNRKKARGIWENLQRDFPEDYRVTHALALLNYWEVLSANNPKSSTQEVIEKTICNWVMLLNSDLFWEAWRRERQPFYFQGDILEGQIEGLRNDLKAQLENIIPQPQQNALLLELETAKLLTNIANWGRRKRLDSQLLIAGPIMLKQLGMLKKARQLALLGQQVDPENNEFKILSLYLTPLGIITFLLKAGRVDDALDELGKIRNRNRWATKEFEEEFSNAIIIWTGQTQGEDEVIIRFERGVRILPSERLKLSLSNGYRSKVNQIAVQPIPDWESICNLLDKALELQPGDESLRRDACIAYYHAIKEKIGKKQNDWLEESLEKAIRAEKIAKGLKIHYEMVAKGLSQIFNGIGVKLVNGEKYWQALKVLKKAKKYNPTDDVIKENIKMIRSTLWWKILKPFLMLIRKVLRGFEG